MSPQEIAKDAIRIVTTAGLSKDVIDLLEKKVALLTDQITTLETENTNLKRKVEKLEKEIERLRPTQGGLEEEAEKILKLLFDNGRPLHLEEMVRSLGMSEGIAQYHCDVLCDVSQGMIGPGPLGTYELLPKGRAYVVKRLLKK